MFKRAIRSAEILGAGTLWLALIPGTAWGQDPENADRLEFKFRGAEIEFVLEYISKRTGLVFSNEAGYKGRVNAVSSTALPKSRVIDFLNTVLRPKKLAAVRVNERIVRIVTLDQAKKERTEIHVGSDPERVERTDRVFTQIVPLKNLDVSSFDRDLRSLVPRTATLAKDPSNNALILTDSGNNIRRFLTLLAALDGAEFQALQMRVIPLRYADAAYVQSVITDFIQGRGRAPSESWSRMWKARREGEYEPAGASSEIVKILPDKRTNSIVLAATPKNLDLLERFVEELDAEPAEPLRVKIYALKGVKATELAATIQKLLTGSPEGARTIEWWDRSARAAMGAAKPVKLVPDPLKNTLMVTGAAAQIELVDRVVKTLDFDPETRVFGIRHADVEKTAGLLQRLTAGYAPKPRFEADPRTGQLYVTAAKEQMEVLTELVDRLDREVADSVHTRMYTLENAEPREVATMLRKVFRERPGAARGVNLVTNDRTRTLLVQAPFDRFGMIDDLVQHLDSVAPDQEVTYVVELKSASPTRVAAILRSLSGGEVQTNTPSGLRPKSVRTGYGRTVPERNAGGSRNFGPSIRRGGGSRNLGPLRQDGPDPKQPGQEEAAVAQPETKTTGDVRVEADEDSNVLVVKARKRDLEAIKEVIEKLDRYRPQVLINVLVVEVTLDDDLRYGVEAFWENRLKIPRNDPALQKLSTSLGLGSGGFGYDLSSGEFQTSLQALAEQGRLKVLATPRILATDNLPAKFSVGKSVPIISDSRQTPEGSVLNTVQYAEVGIILSVLPKVNADGMVTLNVRPEVSDVASAGGVAISPGSNAPVFIRNFAETTLTVRDGRTVVLGGLIRESEDERVSKVPILGDVPLIGNLFSSTSRSAERRELMIFITPHVVWTQGELEELTNLEAMKLKLIPQREVRQEIGKWLDDFPR